jgi:hypothetical protein
MADIFNRISDNYGGSFSADAARVTFVQDGVLGQSVGDGVALRGVGMLVQSLTFNYQQQVTRIYEVGTNFSFYVAGRTQGGLSMGRVLGPRPLMPVFYQKYGDVCNASTNSLDIEMATGCRGAGEFNQKYAFTLKFCVIISLGVSVAAQDMLINEQLSLLFCALNLRAL